MDDNQLPATQGSQLPSVWAPKPFEGSDLLPVRAGKPEEELVGRENVSQRDMILPVLKLLQGMSPGVADGSIEGARAGLILHTASQQVLKPPLRVLLIHHSKSNFLNPDPKDPRHAGLERCLSKDAHIGDRYGDCHLCGKCTEWKDNQKPLGSQSHNFVAMTELGPAVLRFSRTSFKAAKQFVTAWTMGQKNLWAHPVVVRVKMLQDKAPDGTPRTYFAWEPIWQVSEVVPEQVRATARETYEMVQAAYEAGRLQGDEEETSEE